MITLRSTRIKNATNATANIAHASTSAAVIESIRIAGVSSSPSNGIKFPIIRERDLSLTFPAITTNRNQRATNRKGNGATFPVGGMHLVWSLLRIFPSGQVFIVGMHESCASFGS